MLTDSQINAAIAEKAEGWKHWEFTRADGSTFVMFMSSDASNSAYIKTRNAVQVESGDDLKCAPDYLTDPVASQALKEAMRKLGWTYTICGDPLGRFCCLFSREGERPMFFVEDHSELRAIALAACRALGIEGV